MEHSRHILLSSFESHDLCGEDSSRQSRRRKPLSSLVGNAQPHKLASAIYHEDKGHQSQFNGDAHMYPLTTLPSQSVESAGYALQRRKQIHHIQREQRQARRLRNPIVDSPQYQAYRERQTREGSDDQKWPDVLEDAFLDALLIMPIMGRRKFSYRGKPHGRNELIAEYIWIYYLQSLSPSERPDQLMRRGRKQVSSHIQVIKGFLKTHPDVHKLFPKVPKPENGFQDSFKNDPCLRAISEGRLPNKKYSRFNNHHQYNNDLKPVRTLRSGPIRPSLFWLLITSHEIEEDHSGRFDNKDDLYAANVVAHEFSSLSSETARGTLDSIPNWQHKFPAMENMQIMGELNCDIIHMNVSLDLMTDYPGEGAELRCRTELSIPGRAPDGCEWGARTTFTKPPELCRDPVSDPASEPKEFNMKIIPSSDAETRFKVPFPATAWANAFTRLIRLQEMRRSGSEYPIKSAREYIEELSMYQEIVYSTTSPATGERTSFIRKAIILWTFHKTRLGEANHTFWRYIDAFPPPPRRACMSPSPHSSHHVSAAMYENFSSLVETPHSMLLQQPHHPSMLVDPFTQGLATPPLTGGLQSPFHSQTYSFNPSLSFDMPSENLSFISSKTADSESTLVDDNTHTSQIDHYLSNNINLGDYENSSNWQMPVSSESFDTDPGWGNYEASQTPQMGWDHTIQTPSAAILDSTKTHQEWHDHPVDPHHQQEHRQQQKNIAWIDETGPSKHDWLAEAIETSNNSPEKHQESYIEQSIEQRLLPWIESHDISSGTDSTKNSSIDVTDAAAANSILRLTAGQEGDEMAMVDDNTNGWGNDVGVGGEDDTFDYADLAERLK